MRYDTGVTTKYNREHAFKVKPLLVLPEELKTVGLDDHDTGISPCE